MSAIFTDPSSGQLMNYFKQHQGKLLWQQPIIYQVWADHGAGAARKLDMADDNIPDDRKFVYPLEDKAGSQYGHLRIMPLDPAMRWKGESVTRVTDRHRESRQTIFQCYNGITIPAHITNDAQWNEEFVYAGQPMRRYDPDQSWQMQYGVACAVAGSKNMFNNGFDEW
jgi:hypothetical protein